MTIILSTAVNVSACHRGFAWGPLTSENRTALGLRLGGGNSFAPLRRQYIVSNSHVAINAMRETSKRQNERRIFSIMCTNVSTPSQGP